MDRINYIEPNDIDLNNPNKIPHSYEDYTMYVDLKAYMPRRDSSGTLDKYSLQSGSFSLMAGTNGMLTTNYTDINLNKKINEGDNSKEGVGIESIHISYDTNFIPQVSIKFVDSRGGSFFTDEELFYRKNVSEGRLNIYDEQNPSLVKAIFAMPSPTFILEVKGFYGRLVRLKLVRSNVKVSFNNKTGNFEMDVTFIGQMFGVYADLPMVYIIAAPFMEYFGREYWETYDKIGDKFSYYEDNMKILDLVELSTRISEIADVAGRLEMKDIGNINGRRTNYDDIERLYRNLIESFYKFILGKKEGEKIDIEFDTLYNENNENIFNIYCISQIDYNFEKLLSFEEDDVSKLNNNFISFKQKLDEEQSLKICPRFLVSFDKLYFSKNDIKKVYQPDEKSEPLSEEEIKDKEIYLFFGLKHIRKEKIVSITNENSEKELFIVRGLNNEEKVKLSDKVEEKTYNEIYSKCSSLDEFYIYAICDNYFLDKLEENKTECTEELNEALLHNENLEKEITKLLGFFPSVGNVMKTIFAHMETFIASFYNCLDIIKNSGRNVLSLELNGNIETDIPRDKMNDPASFVYPFPLLFKKNKDYNGRNELLKPGEIYSNNISFTSQYYEELKLVNSIYDASKGIENKWKSDLEYSEQIKNQQTVGLYNVGAFLPITLFDFYFKGKGINPYYNIEKKSEELDILNIFSNIFILRFISHLFSYFCVGNHNVNVQTSENTKTFSGHISDMPWIKYFGRIEAINFYFGNKEKTYKIENFVNAITDIQDGSAFDDVANNFSSDEYLRLENNDCYVPLFFRELSEIIGDVQEKKEIDEELTSRFVSWHDISNMLNNKKTFFIFESSYAPNYLAENYTQIINILSYLGLSFNKDRFLSTPGYNEVYPFFTTLSPVYERDKKESSPYFSKLRKNITYDSIISGASFTQKDIKVSSLNIIKYITEDNIITFSKIPCIFASEIYRSQGDHFTNDDEWLAKAYLFLCSLPIDRTNIFYGTSNTTRLYSEILQEGALWWRYKEMEKKENEGITNLRLISPVWVPTDYKIPKKNEGFLSFDSYYARVTSESKFEDDFYDNGTRYAFTLIKEKEGEKETDKPKSSFKNKSFVVREYSDFTIYNKGKNEKKYNISEERKDKEIEMFKDWAKSDFRLLSQAIEDSLNDIFKNESKETVTMLCDTVDLDLNISSLNKFLSDNYFTFDLALYKRNILPVDKKGFKENLWKRVIVKEKRKQTSLINEAIREFGETLKKLYNKNENTILPTTSNSLDGSYIASSQEADMKLSIYLTLKSLYDKHFCGERRERWKLPDKKDEKEMLLRGKTDRRESDFENFIYVDKFYDNIRDLIPMNLKFLKDSLNGLIIKFSGEMPPERVLKKRTVYNSQRSVLQFMEDILNDSGMSLVAFPIGNSLLDPNRARKMFTPLLVSNGDFNDVDNYFMCIYKDKTSEILNIVGADYSSDNVDLPISSDIADSAGNPNAWVPEAFYEDGNYSVPAFGVSFGKGNQSYFTGMNINMDNFKNTDMSLRSEQDIARGGANNSAPLQFYGQSIYSTYSNYGFTITIEAMGNMEIMPGMFFQLNNIPMFKGAYMIYHVEHEISRGNMKTIFTGGRLRRSNIPLASSGISSVNANNIIDNKGQRVVKKSSAEDLAKYDSIVNQGKITIKDEKYANVSINYVDMIKTIARKSFVANLPSEEEEKKIKDFIYRCLLPFFQAWYEKCAERGKPEKERHIIINSGFRTFDTQGIINPNMSNKSAHEEGYAADLKTTSGEFSAFCVFAAEWFRSHNEIGFDQLIKETNGSGSFWLHVGWKQPNTGHQRSQLWTYTENGGYVAVDNF